jgi:hypothetical protein
MSLQLKRAGPLLAVLALALTLVPAASSGTYGDASGDNVGGAGDVTGVTVTGDKNSGQLVFRVAGVNIASSQQNVLFVDIDTDANPATGDLLDGGTEYSFYIDDNSYGFGRWEGSDWVRAPNSTVRVSGGTSLITISVNRSELGNTSDFNFEVTSLAVPLGGSGSVGLDSAPDDGSYNYSFDSNGPLITSVDVRTTPSGGPRAGKAFKVEPTALHLPPDGRTSASPIVAESYTCTAKLGSKALTGTGTGSCTFAIPKKKSHGKKLTVRLTVNYEGATKVIPYTFTVR